MVSKNLSVCLSICLVCYKLWLKLSRDWLNKIGKKKFGHLWQKPLSQKNLFVQKVAAGPGLRAKIATFWPNSCLTWDQSEILKIDLIFHLNRTKNQLKKVYTFGCQSCLVSSFLLQKQLIYDFLAENNYPNSPHLQGGMSILPLSN